MKSSNSVGVIFVENLGFAENGNKRYLCKCPECGSLFETYASSYYSNRNSCKCAFIGKSNPRLYSIWINMKTRCCNPNVPGYKNYGGRGITICDEWKNSFKNFLDWSIENGYSENLSIDRIDVNGNYTPENCKWSDDIEQANNKRNTIYVGGMSLKKYCRENGLNYKTIHNRKSKHPEESIYEIINYYTS